MLHKPKSITIYLRLAFTFMLFVMFFQSKAQDKIESDRPDQTETAETVPLHYFQGEFGFRYENEEGKNYTINHPVALLKYGLFDKFELRLEGLYKTEYQHLIPKPQTSTGFDPFAFGFKLALLDEKGLVPKTSLITQVSIPTFASSEFKAQHAAPSFVLAMKNTISKTADLGYNLGVEWDGFSTSPYYIYSLSFGLELSEKWSMYAEPFGFVYLHQAAVTVFDGGLQYYINKNVKLDVSAGFGLSEAAVNYYMDAGLSFRFK